MPLAPVPPLHPPSESTPSNSTSDNSGFDWWSLLIGTVAVVSLGFNGWFGWNLARTQRIQDKRLAKLEAAPADASNDRANGDETTSNGRLPRRATLDQRLAALLAVAGDADRSRRLLENVSPTECAQLGQALLKRTPASDRNAALTAVVNCQAGGNPGGAVALIDGVRETLLRATLARQLAETWIAKAPDAAAQWLVGDGTRFLGPTAAAAPLVRAITQWSTFDPEAAARFVAAQPLDRGPVARTLNVASHAWGQTDPPAALAWATAIPAGDPRHGQAIAGVWEGWTERDPGAAGTALRQQFYAGANRPSAELAGTVGRQWAQTDPAAASRWAPTLPTPGARANALYQVAMAWVQTDPSEAARWSMSLPASDTRARIWREILGTWADNDLDAAGTWLGSLPAGRDHDEAVGVYLPKIESTDPEKALAWVGTVSDPGLRAEQAQEVLGRWQRRDAAAARNWAAANGVPILPARAAAP